MVLDDPKSFTWGSFGKTLATVMFWGGLSYIPMVLIKDEVKTENSIKSPTGMQYLVDFIKLGLLVLGVIAVYKLAKGQWKIK